MTQEAPTAVVSAAAESGENWAARVRALAGDAVFRGIFHGLSTAARLHPQSEPQKHGVEVIRDVPYRATASDAHRLDLYVPRHCPAPWPVALYLHGGSFRILSKETHWVMGLSFARKGYLTLVANYRLAPRHRYPAAVEDACDAYLWATRQAESFGGDPHRIVVAGESAGANLATGLALASCYRRPEAWARRVWDADNVPRAILPACGILEVRNTERFTKRHDIPFFVADRLREITQAYLGPEPSNVSGFLDFADPLTMLERRQPPDRPLPPFFVSCGTRDVLLDDSRRLARALDRLGIRHELRVYPDEMHAFHALVWRENAKDVWRRQFAFLDSVLAES